MILGEILEILSHVPALLRRRSRAGVVSRRLRSHAAGGRHRSAARRRRSMPRPRSRPARRSSRRSRRTCTPTSCRARASWRRPGARDRITGPARISSTRTTKCATASRSRVGDVTLTFLHTPGHTPEHICVLADSAGEPARLFTGDLLFVGGVGRPDLARRRADARAGATSCSTRCSGSWRSTTASRCIRATAPDRSAAPASARNPRRRSARERRQNAMLQHADRDAFVARGARRHSRDAAVLRADEAREQGRGRRSLDDRRAALPSIRPAAAAALAADGALISTCAPAEAFAAGHPVRRPQPRLRTEGRLLGRLGGAAGRAR